MIKQIDRLDEEIIIPLADNAIKTSQFIASKDFCHELLNRWAVYFNKKTQIKWVWEENNKVEAICMCIVGDGTKDVHYNLSGLIPKSEQEKQYMIFRQRITAGYKDISFPCEAELEIMSSLKKYKGIGKQLLAKVEEELVSLGVKQYIVCTNEMCDYAWYLNHGFRLYQFSYVDISDLNLIFGDMKNFKIYCLIKDIPSKLKPSK